MTETALYERNMFSVKEMLDSAICYHRNGEIAKALTLYRRILQAEPDQSQALHGMGIIAFHLKKYDVAHSLITRAIKRRPDVACFHYNAGLASISLNRADEAVSAFKEAIRLNPAYSDAYYNLGLALKNQQQFDNAVENFRTAIHLCPEDADAHYNLGNTYKALDRYEAAAESYRMAVRCREEFPEAHHNLGVVLKIMGLLDVAIRHFRKSIHLQTDLAEPHWSLSLALLLNGEFEEGWKEHEWRFKMGKMDTIYPHVFEIPRWDGSPFPGRRLFVHSEQGFGDTLHFVRYLPLVKRLGGKVVFETFKPLLEIMKGFSEIDELVEISPNRDFAETCDYYAPLMSLPMLLRGRFETIPQEIPYITADPEKATQWNQRIGKAGLKIGIAWAGKPAHKNDKNRSCQLRHFLPLTEIPGVSLYSLQKGDAVQATETFEWAKCLIRLDRELSDFSVTAAVIENLDLVISVDTALVHLAGAMGKPVWILLPHAPDWRWMLHREDSPWYPTMRLFRQPLPGNWNSVFEKVRDELYKLISRRRE